MKKLIYKGIKFDDYENEIEDYGTYFVQMCDACYQKYKGVIDGGACNGAIGTCSVFGCDNEADHYIDFLPNGVHFEEDFTFGNFIDDKEKMLDFKTLSKAEFLASYSYLTEEEYDNTAEIYERNIGR